MTEREIVDLEVEIEKYNAKQQKAAQAKFDKGPVPQKKWVMEQTLGRLLDRIAVVKSGKAPNEFGLYMRDELARILATETCLAYDGLALDRNVVISADSGTPLESVSYENYVTLWTPEFGLWRQIVTALDEYLYSAAVLAKSLNASSTAARLYLRAWRIVKRIEDYARSYGCANKDEALAIVRLERVAADRLWVDAQFAALPPFREAEEKSTSKSPSKKKKDKKAN